jgi:NitT/TauT family transport system ATP-binding protein
MTAIVFDKVWKEYGDHVVLERIDLVIAPRSFVALVGPSGCGKTTFLRMLLGEERPTRGQILVGGVPLKAEPNADRGVVFQRYSVFPHLTVLANVMIGREFERSPLLGKLFGLRRREVEAEARTLLEAVGLKGHEDKYPTALSGGMQQRLALAQALNRKPKILLLDEPFGALDPGIRADIHVLIRRIWNENNLTVVMVTHDLSEAFRLGTRVVAFERPRNRPEEAERYGATLDDISLADAMSKAGASITRDFEVWPKKIAGPLPNGNGAQLDLTLTPSSDSKPAG